MSKVLISFLIISSISLFSLHVVQSAPSKRRNNTNVEEMADLFEGDIILSGDQERAINIAATARVALSGIVGEKYRWDNRIVHYEISGEYCKNFVFYFYFVCFLNSIVLLCSV